MTVVQVSSENDPVRAVARDIYRDVHKGIRAELFRVTEEAGRLDPGDPEDRRVYLERAAFTSVYLAHQDLEERVVMPRLEAVVGVEGMTAIHEAVLAAIPPADMARTLPLMLPAVNVEDRSELLGALRANAPAAVFERVWGLARSVLDPADLAVTARRLGFD